MNIGLLFFTYTADAPLLACALRAAPRLRAQGHSVSTYIVDDAAHPLASPGEVVPPDAVYTRTTFDRGGNLNGLPCITAMADIYAAYAPAHDWLIKADCDTFVNHLQWLEGVDPTATGIVGTVHVNSHASGACYAISAVGAQTVQGLLKTELWQRRATRAHCEDRFFYCALRMQDLVLGRDSSANAIHPHLLHHDWYTGGHQTYHVLTRAAAVDFKACRWNSPRENWDADRATALTRMQEYTSTLNIKH